MHILIVTPWYPSEENRVLGYFVLKQAEIIAREHDVTVIHQMSVPVYRYLSARKIVREEYAGITVCRVRFPSLRGAARILNRKTVMNAFRMIHRDRPVDIVHAHVGISAGDCALWIRRKEGIPVVLTEHSQRLKFDLKNRRIAGRLRRIWNDVDALTAVNRQLRDLLNGHHEKRQAVEIPNAVDTEFLTPAPPKPSSDSVTMLFVGYMNNDRKGADLLLHAVSKVRAKSEKNLKAHLYGSGGQKLEEYKNLAARLGIDDIVQFHGFAPESEIRSVMRNADFFILPSRSETFAVSVAEAMACGKPVIVTRCGGPEEYVEDFAGIVVPPNDADALAEAMITMIGTYHAYDAERIAAHIDSLFGPKTFLRKLNEIYVSATAENMNANGNNNGERD